MAVWEENFMLTRKEYLLQKLQEECMEVAQRASKAVVFGLEEVPALEVLPGNTARYNNAQMVMAEVNDLFGVLFMLWDEGILPGLDDVAIKAKRAKVEKYMAYSRKLGILELQHPHDHGSDC